MSKSSSDLNVLIACECSQVEVSAFRAAGCNAFSCDLQPCYGGHPEWHIWSDVLYILDGNRNFVTQDGVHHTIVGKWDLIIAHPPCTYLSNAGARHLWRNHELNLERYELGSRAASFFFRFLNADCEHVAVENPTPSRIFDLPQHSQVVQPFQFGHPYTKRTLLWLRNLPLLVPTNIVEPLFTWCPSSSYKKHHSNRYRGVFTSDRARMRSRSFEGIAAAMATQWVDYLISEV